MQSNVFKLDQRFKVGSECKEGWKISPILYDADDTLILCGAEKKKVKWDI